MKNYFVILGSVVLFHLSFSQNYSIEYICQTNLDNGGIYDGITTLHISRNQGIFIHNDVPNTDDYESTENGFVFIKGDIEGYPVFTDLGEDSLIFKTIYGSPREHLIIKEKRPEIIWDTSYSDTKVLGSYTCNKATGLFGNRQYTVWYTKAIPLAFGPYKLSGLPGVILEAESTDNRVSYHFNKIMHSFERIEPPHYGKALSWSELEAYTIERLHRTESLSTPNTSVTNVDPTSDYDIEKDKFVFISNYRRKE